MACHVCGAEAVGRCYSCGALFCAKHGDENCFRCDSGFRAGDPRRDRFTASPGLKSNGGWWRPQQAEGYTPPACYHCKGIAHRACQHCGQRYCPEHAGSNGMCAACNQSSYLGIAILGAVGLLLLFVLIYGWLQGSG